MTLTNWSNMTDLSQLPAVANTASNGSFWPGMLIMLWIIMILIMIGYGFEIAFLVASFLALILSIFLVYSGLIAWWYSTMFVGICLFMFLYIIWSGSRKA